MDKIVTWFEEVSFAIPIESKKLLCALIFLVCIDYISGICVAIKNKAISSKVGAKGLATKIMIFIMVSIGAIIDHLLIGSGSTIFNITMLFYSSNELISICENATQIGLPLPKKVGFAS